MPVRIDGAGKSASSSTTRAHRNRNWTPPGNRALRQHRPDRADFDLNRLGELDAVEYQPSVGQQRSELALMLEFGIGEHSKAVKGCFVKAGVVGEGHPFEPGTFGEGQLSDLALPAKVARLKLACP